MTPEGLYGRRKMTALLRRTTAPGASAGSVDRAMRTLGLSGVRRDKGVRTTIPAKDGKRAGDLLDRDFSAEAPNRVWVTDFTYVRTWAGWVYVAFIVDAFAREDVTWSMLRSMLVKARLPPIGLLGPAIVASVAYVDPGNVATNVTAGSTFGYTLVWVVVMANVMAVLVQYLSAKLGMVTGQSLAGHMGRRLRRGPRIAYWLQAEAIAIATDLAEVVGGAIALSLLFDLPLMVGAIITAGVAMLILRIGDVHGQGALERVVMGFLALIAVGFMAGLFIEPPAGRPLAAGLIPTFEGPESVLLASGIIGATVMPHVIYLHSSLTTSRLGRRGEGLSVRRLLAATRLDVVLALALAGMLNLSLLVVAAASLDGLPDTDTLEGVHALVSTELGAGVALLFAVSLLGSGLASTSVGSAAGAEVMHGLLGLRLPILLRRVVTLVPALVVLGLGMEPSRALVVSQVVLSIGIPFALVPLMVLTARRDVMGEHVNAWATTAAACVVAAIVIGLNVSLIWLTIVG